MQDTSAMEAFWQWFTGNADFYRALPEAADAQDELFAALQLQLDRIAPDLFFVINDAEDGHCDLVLSPDGNLELFPVIEALVAAAPKLTGWKYTAYRQRGPADVSIQINDFTLGPEQIYFALAPDGEQIAITLHIADYNLFTDHQLGVASFLLLDNALGEYDVALKVSAIGREPMPEGPSGHGLQPLDELPATFDAFYAEMRANG